MKGSFLFTGIKGVTLTDFVKWMTGSSQIPTLRFPKKFTLERAYHELLQGQGYANESLAHS